MIYFTSDTHLGHANIITYCHRPFKSVGEMDSVIIYNWNNTVAPDDTVYHLGDFCFGHRKEWERYRFSLNGNIHLILGNHDLKAFDRGYCDGLFESIKHADVVYIGGQKIYLSHFPYLCFDGELDGKSLQFFGHVHSGTEQDRGYDLPRLKHLFPTQYDVGVDNNNYTPVSIESIFAKINAKKL